MLLRCVALGGVAWRWRLGAELAWRARGLGAEHGVVVVCAWCRALRGVRWVACVGWRGVASEARNAYALVASEWLQGNEVEAVRAVARRTPLARATASLRSPARAACGGKQFWGRGGGGRLGGHRRGVGCDFGLRIIRDFQAKAEPRHASFLLTPTKHTPNRTPPSIHSV